MCFQDHQQQYPEPQRCPHQKVSSSVWTEDSVFTRIHLPLLFSVNYFVVLAVFWPVLMCVFFRSPTNLRNKHVDDDGK